MQRFIDFYLCISIFRSGYVNFSLVRFLGLHIEWNVDTQCEVCIAA